MTKSTITREQLLEIIETDHVQCGEASHLARMALAAMDSEPVKRVNADQMHHVCLEANRHLDKYGAMAKEVNKLLGRIPAHPAPVVPEEATPDSIEILASARLRDHAVFQWDEDQRNAAADSWNAFRAAMLQAVNSPVIGIDQATGADRTVEVRYVAPPGYVMLPKEPTKEMIDAGWLHYMATKNPSSKGTYKAMLAAAPQSPGSEPATVPGKWIPVSERMPESNKFVLVSNGVWVGQGLYDDSEHLESDEHWQDEHREFINVLHHPVTHWMQLPAGPQEVPDGK